MEHRLKTNHMQHWQDINTNIHKFDIQQTVHRDIFL